MCKLMPILERELADVNAARQIIAQRAEGAIGVRFRLHGRSLITGLDCVGLVAHAAAPFIDGRAVPQNYQMRFDNLDMPIAFFRGSDFGLVDHEKPHQMGDIILIKPAVQQLHFIINLGRSFVHAHSGLRRIVQSNHPILSPAAAWRYKGK